MILHIVDHHVEHGHGGSMPVVQFTPVRFRRGTTIHANLLYNSRTTVCGKSVKDGVIIMDHILDCAQCIARMAYDRKKSRAKAKR